MNLREEADILTHYYMQQAGDGGAFYQGAAFQRGHGIGLYIFFEIF
jgi:hypothetical protein